MSLAARLSRALTALLPCFFLVSAPHAETASDRALPSSVRFLFRAFDHDARAWRLYLSDGTSAGTNPISIPTLPQQDFSLHSLPGHAVVDWLDPAAKTPHLAFVDAKGTIVDKVYPAGSTLDYFEVVDGKLYFRIQGAAVADEVGVTDGTLAGTKVVASVPEKKTFAGGVFHFKGALYLAFFGASAADTQIYVYKAVGSRLASAFTYGREPIALICCHNFPTPVGDRLLFMNWTKENGVELWATNGTQGGMRLVRDFNPGPGDGTDGRGQLSVVGGRLLFMAYVPGEGQQLWSSDGTAAGTQRLTGVAGEIGDVWDNVLVVDGGTAYFALRDGNSAAFYETDGSAAGTRKEAWTLGGQPVSIPALTGPPPIVNGWMYLQMRPNGSAVDTGLYRVDLASGGAELLKNLRQNCYRIGVYDDDISGLTRVGPAVVYSALDECVDVILNTQPWITFGTPATTSKVKQIGSRPRGSKPWDFTPIEP